MSRGHELAAVPATAPLEPVDPRAGQMRCLVELDVLGEEWDACRSRSPRAREDDSPASRRVR